MSSSSNGWGRRPYVVALQNERDVAEPPTRLKLYKTGGKAPADRSAAAVRAAGADGHRGGARPACRATLGQGRYLHDFGVLGAGREHRSTSTALGALVADTFGAVWDGRAGSDWLNRLVVAGELELAPGVRSCAPTESIASCWGPSSRVATRTTAWCETTHIAGKLVELFEALFDPSRELDTAAVDALREAACWPTSRASPALTTTAFCAATLA